MNLASVKLPSTASKLPYPPASRHQFPLAFSPLSPILVVESRDALSLGNLKGERSHLECGLGVVIRDLSLDSLFLFSYQSCRPRLGEKWSGRWEFYHVSRGELYPESPRDHQIGRAHV